jgi:membrane associated rhomboid family serine protease
LAGKAPLLVKSSSQANKSPSLATEPVQKTANPPQPAAFGPPTPRQFVKGANSSDIKDTEGEKILTIDAKEEAIQRNIAIRRTKVLWPGIWTIFALLGTYGTLAYLDVKAGVPSSDGSQLSERTQLPQTWYLTPSIVLEAFKGAWNDLDKLTVGIFVASFAIHLLRRSPLPIWEKFIHVTGEKKYTAFTYPFVNANWTHLWLNMAALIWVMPSVVRYFDGDLYHTSALLISVPLITSYLSHFAYRFNLASGLMLNLGASGAIAAAFGVYFVGYADEKMWAPPGILLRLDAKYWGIFFAATQLRGAFKGASGGNRPAYMVSP